MPEITKEALLAMTLTRVPVELPEGTAYIRELSGADRDEMETAWLKYQREAGHDENDYRGWFAAQVAFCLVDANGKRLFTDAEIDAVNNLPCKVRSRLANVLQRLNGLGPYAEVDLPLT